MLARELFNALYVLSGKTEARLSAANMTLKLGNYDEALAEYDKLLATCELSKPSVDVVTRKRAEAAAGARVGAYPPRLAPESVQFRSTASAASPPTLNDKKRETSRWPRTGITSATLTSLTYKQKQQPHNTDENISVFDLA